MLPFGRITSLPTGKTIKTAYQLCVERGQSTAGAQAFLCPYIKPSALSATSLQAPSEPCHGPSVSAGQCTQAWKRRMRKPLSFFAEHFLFHLFLCSEKEKKESVLSVMYRDTGSETAAVLPFSSKHPCAQWPFISRSGT